MQRFLTTMTVLVGAAVAAQTATGGPVDPQRSERCAVRVAIALTGKSPSAAVLATSNPQSEVPTLLASPEFIERFARFINSQFNDAPGASSADDAAYHLAKKVLTDGKPWRDLFVGRYDVALVSGAVQVRDDPNGVGYFRSKAWLERYAGNEEHGVKLATAYRMLQNTTGIKLKAAVQAAGQDFSATGRQAAECRGCHYDGWFALDRIASVLTTKVEEGTTIRFVAPTAGPQELLDGRLIADDKELLTALVGSTDFDFRVCRLAFEFLYGRKELACEGPVFDRCVDAFRASGTVQAALSAVATDPAYCQ